MCVSSMIGDYYADKWRHNFPWVLPGSVPASEVPVSRFEFEALKRDVEEMKVLLARAIKYDQEHNEPACETESKMDLLRRIAKVVGVDLDDVLGKGVNHA